LRVGTALAASPRPVHVFFHDGPVTQALYSPDGKRVATLSGKTVRVWNAATGKVVFPPLRHAEALASAWFSRDGRRLLTQSVEKVASGPGRRGSPARFGTFFCSVRVWDMGTGRPLTGPVPSGLPPSLSPDGARLLTLSALGGKSLPLTRTAQVWDLATGRPQGPSWNCGPVIADHFLEGGRVLTVSAARGDGSPYWVPDWGRWTWRECEVRLWAGATGALVRGPIKLPGSFLTLAEGPKGLRLLTRSFDKVTLWDAHGRKIASHGDVHGFADEFRFSPDGRRLLLFSQNERSRGSGWSGSARLVDATTGAQLQTSLVSGEQLSGVSPFGPGISSFSPDGSTLGLTFGSTVRLYADERDRLDGQTLRHEAAVSQVRFSPDRRRVLTVATDNAVRLWETGTATLAGPVLSHETAVRQADFSPDGTTVLTVSNNTVRIWPVVHVPPQGQSVVLPDSSNVAIASPDGRHVLARGERLRLWETSTGRLVRTFDPRATVHFSPDGRWLAVGGDGVAVSVWDTTTARRAWQLQVGALPRGTSCQFSPDGRRLLLPHSPTTVRIRDTATGKPLAPPLDHAPLGRGGRGVRGRFDASGPPPGFSPRGDRLVTLSVVGEPSPGKGVRCKIRVWSVADGRLLVGPIRPELPPSVFVYRVEFSADGRRLVGELRRGAAGSLERGFFPLRPEAAFLAWDATTGKALSPPVRADGPSAFQVTPEGGRQIFLGWTVVGLTHDGRHAFLIGAHPQGGGQAVLWDIDARRPGPFVVRHDDRVWQAALSPDGARLITVAGKVARVWDAHTGEPLTPPLQHPEAVSHAQFSSDSRLVCTGCSVRGPDRKVRVWDAANGQPLTPFLPSLLSPATSFSANGRCMLVARPGGIEALRLEETDQSVEELLALARVLSGRRLGEAGSVVSLDADRFRDGWLALRRARRALESPAPDRLSWHRQELAECLPAREPPLFDQGPWDGKFPSALWHLERLLEAEKPGAQRERYTRLRGYLLVALGRWDEAVRAYDDLVASGKEEAPWYERGAVQAIRGRYRDAAADFLRATRQPDRACRAWLALAAVRLHLGDQPGYREACTRAVESLPAPGRAPAPGTVRDANLRLQQDQWLRARLAFACAAAPGAVKDYDALLRALGAAAPPPRKSPGARPRYLYNGVTLWEQAALHYRAGRVKQADALLREFAIHHQLARSPFRSGYAHDAHLLFQALVHHARGEKTEASRALALGAQLEEYNRANARHADAQSGPYLRWSTWEVVLLTRQLRREAELLILGRKADSNRKAEGPP
jgi:WD40 repeat protein